MPTLNTGHGDECTQLNVPVIAPGLNGHASDVTSAAVVQAVLTDHKQVDEKLPLYDECTEDDEELERPSGTFYVEALSSQMGGLCLTSILLFIPNYGLTLLHVHDFVNRIQTGIVFQTFALNIACAGTAAGIRYRLYQAQRAGSAEIFGQVLMERGPGWRQRLIPFAFDVPFYICMASLAGLSAEITALVWYAGTPQEQRVPVTAGEIFVDGLTPLLILIPLIMLAQYLIDFAYRVHRICASTVAAGVVGPNGRTAIVEEKV